MTRLILPAFILAAVCASACAPLERSRNLGDPRVPAKTLAQQVCAECHGVTGHATSPNFPNLAAQQRDYLVAQLKDFRSHGRLDPPGYEYMWGLSRHLSDGQITGLSDYFAAQPSGPVHAKGALESPLVAAGRALYQKGAAERGVQACSECHGEHAEGDAQSPRLAGQHKNYLVRQLIVFRRTDQRPAGADMKEAAHSLTEADIRALAAYLHTEPGS